MLCPDCGDGAAFWEEHYQIEGTLMVRIVKTCSECGRQWEGVLVPKMNETVKK